MLASPLPPFLPDKYSLSMSSFKCKTKGIVIRFLVFWSICMSSFHVFLNSSPKYLKTRKHHFDDITTTELDFKKFSRLSEVLFGVFFFHFAF